MNKTEPAVWSG